MADDKRNMGRISGEASSDGATNVRIIGKDTGDTGPGDSAGDTPRRRHTNGNGGRGASGGSTPDAGGDSPEVQGQEADTAPHIRVVSDSTPARKSDPAPKPPTKAEAAAAAKKGPKLAQAVRTLAASRFAAKACDTVSMVATMFVGTPYAAMAPEEREEIQPHLTALLARYDWIAKADTASDAVSLVVASAMYATRVYTMRQMAVAGMIPGATPHTGPLNLVTLLFKRSTPPVPQAQDAGQPIPQEAPLVGAVQFDNSPPADIDYTTAGFAPVG